MYVVLGDTTNFENEIGNMSTKKVILSLPKFKVEYTTELAGILSQIGIVKVFEKDNHDYDVMVKNVHKPLTILKAMQKAIIEVDEKGTEAAAATAFLASVTSAPPPVETVEFKANEPFTYYICDEATDEILFAGRYVKCEP